MSYIVALFFPFLYFLFWEDRIIAAVIALALTTSVVGWPIAAIWALVTCRKSRKQAKLGKKIADV